MAMRLHKIDLREYKTVRFIGDIHGNYKGMTFDIVQRQKLYNAVVIVCGDVGLGFYAAKRDFNDLSAINEKLVRNNVQLCLIRGNHDDPRIYTYTHPLYLQISEQLSHIKIIPDYTVLQTTVGNILCIGGARSVDKTNRTKGISWWDGEMVQEMPDGFFKLLNDDGLHIDVICSHTAPSFASPIDSNGSEALNYWGMSDETLIAENRWEREYLSDLYRKMVSDNGGGPAWWLHGHFHFHDESIYRGAGRELNIIALDEFHPNKHFINNNPDVFTGAYVIDNDWFDITKDIRNIKLGQKKYTYAEFYSLDTETTR